MSNASQFGAASRTARVLCAGALAATLSTGCAADPGLQQNPRALPAVEDGETKGFWDWFFEYARRRGWGGGNGGGGNGGGGNGGTTGGSTGDAGATTGGDTTGGDTTGGSTGEYDGGGETTNTGGSGGSSGYDGGATTTTTGGDTTGGSTGEYDGGATTTTTGGDTTGGSGDDTGGDGTTTTTGGDTTGGSGDDTGGDGTTTTTGGDTTGGSGDDTGGDGTTTTTGGDTTGGSGDDTGGDTTSTTGGTTGATTGGDPQEAARVYFYGHSLANYGSASVGTGMCAVASGEGDACCGDGSYPSGFWPSAFSFYGPPIAQQTHGDSCWSGSFASSGFTDVVITETNFYWDSEPVETSAEAGANLVQDMRASYFPSGDIYLYEHWPEFERGTTFETWKHGDYAPFHDWFVDLQDGINARAGANVKLVPVGPIFARLLRDVPALDALGHGDLFLDTQPHGNATTYFIAGLVHYMALYQRPPATDAAAVAAIPGDVHPAVRNHYATIVSLAWSQLQTFVDGSGQSRVF